MPQDAQPNPQTGEKPPVGETPFFANHGTNTFRAAVTGLGVGLTPNALVAAFGERFTRWQLIDWARGRKPSLEVMQYLAGMHRARRNFHDALVVACERAEISPGRSPNIKAWNARRASLGR